MAEIVNLRQFRKAAARKAATQQADENALKFGRSRAQKAREEQDKSRAKSELDGKEIDKAEE